MLNSWRHNAAKTKSGWKISKSDCGDKCRYIKLIYLYPAVVDERQKSQFEKRKRNLKTISPISRGEREIWIPCHSFEKRKGNLKSTSLISRGEREIWIPFPQFREEKEKSDKIFSTFEKRNWNFKSTSPISRGEREYWNSFLFSRGEREKLNSLLLSLDPTLIPCFSSYILGLHHNTFGSNQCIA